MTSFFVFNYIDATNQTLLKLKGDNWYMLHTYHHHNNCFSSSLLPPSTFTHALSAYLNFVIQPFWPTGSGCARGFLGCFDAAWAMRSYGLGKRPLDIITERENAFRILPQTTPENLNKNYQNYGICPDSRYTNLSKSAVKATTVRHLYDCHEGPIDNVDGVEPMDTSAPIEPPQPEGKSKSKV